MERQRIPSLHQLSDDGAALARLLAERYSCRAFHPDPVPRSVIDAILQLAQCAPSWCNVQPWQVIITEGAATAHFADALYAHAASGVASKFDFDPPQGYHGIYDARRKETAWQLYDSLGIQRGDRAASGKQAAENFRLFGAPHAALITTDRRLGVYGVLDCGCYLTSFLLAAQSQGIATIPQAALAAYSPFVRQYFGVPEDRQVVCGVSFGYADAKHPVNGFRTARADIEEAAVFYSTPPASLEKT